MKLKLKGKFYMEDIEDVPISYLCMILEKYDNINHTLRSYIESEIADRLLGSYYCSSTLKHTFRKMALKYHPDKSGGSNDAMKAIIDFYEHLEKIK